jgi:hypothetical protein
MYRFRNKINEDNVDPRFTIKTWNLGTIQGDICDNFWKIFCKNWFLREISPYNRSKFDIFVQENIKEFLNYSNSIYNLDKIKLLSDKYSVENIGKYFRKYYTIVQKIINDYRDNLSIIYFLQELNIPIILMLKNWIKGFSCLSISILDVGNSYTTGIIFYNMRYKLESKDNFNMNKYFNTSFKTLMNVIWDQHSKNSDINEKEKLMESLKNESELIWYEIRHSCFNKSSENNMLCVLLKDISTGKKVMCLNIHNPCWWINDVNTSEIHENMLCEEYNNDKSIQTQINNINYRNYFDNDILYILRNISIHNAIDILSKDIDKDELCIILAGDFNIQGNLDYDVSNHLDGNLKTSDIENFNQKIKKLNFNANKFLNTNFDLLNCHKKFYPSNKNEAGKVKIIVKDKEKNYKVEKDVNFYTQKSFDTERILDRIYVSKNLKIDYDNKPIEPSFFSDHNILNIKIK